MFKKLMKGVVVTATVMTLGSTGAFAIGDGKASLNDYVYDVTSALTTMHVSSSDGAKWDTIEDDVLTFFAHMKIDTKWPGEVSFVGVVLGKCPVQSCKVLPILWSKPVFARDFIDQTYISVPTSLLTGTTLELSSERQKIIDTCNQHRSAFGATNRHEFQHSLSTTFVADTKNSWGKIIEEAGHDTLEHPRDIDHEKSGNFTFNVVCKPYTSPPDTSADLQKQEEDEFETADIDLFLSTFANETTQPNPATTCKKGRILVRVNTSTAGPAKFKLWKKVGNGPMTSKVVDVWSSHDGNGGFKAEHTEWVTVSEPTQVQAMAEDMVNSIGETTQWKNIMLQCTGTGTGKGGGLTVGNDEPVLPGLKLSGDFSYVDVGGPKCSRMGKALISFKSNSSDNIHYSLDCTNGQHLSGYVKPVSAPQGGYVAAAMQSFQINKTTVYSCALKTVQPGPVRVHQWKGHTFKCVHRAVETGPNDVQVDPKPTDDAPRTPRAAAVKIAPAPMQTDAGKKRQAGLKKAREAAQKKAEAARKKKAASNAVEAVQRKRAELGKKGRKSNSGNAAMQIARPH
jgi:hypothetical protein